MLLIGVDEAGYGPNLGPLVVSATAWSMPRDVDLSEINEALQASGINIADSKTLYHGGGSLGPLEFGVWLAFLSTDRTGISLEMDSNDPCWQNGFFNKSITDLDWRADELAETFRTTFESFGVQLLRNRCLILGAAAFNQRLDACGSKGTLLSEATLEIVRDVFADVPEHQRNGVVLCDKHGGRNRYLNLLNRFFPDEFFCVVEESRSLSVYRSKEIEFRFQSKGESQLPVALASMF